MSDRFYTTDVVCPRCMAWMLDAEHDCKKCHTCGYTKKKEKLMTFTEDSVLMGRVKKEELTDEQKANLAILVDRMQKLLSAYGRNVIITSGYRSPEMNANLKGAAPKSKHMICAAVDISDVDGNFMKWILDNLALCQQLGLYMEDFRWTPSWVHLQIIAPTSKKRIFVPNSSQPQAPQRWAGSYASKYDF